MNGRPKSHRALIHAAEFAQHPDIDAVDTMLLVCIAIDATSEMGEGSRPGNAALERAAKLHWSATHARIEKLIQKELIQRTETPKGGRGIRHAAVYRLCWWHPAYPDYSPNKQECYLLQPPDPDKASGGPDPLAEKASGGDRTLSAETIRPEGVNHPENRPKLSGEIGKPSGPRPEHNQTSTESQPNPQPNPARKPSAPGSGWDGFFSSLPEELKADSLNTKHRRDLEQQLTTHGLAIIKAAMKAWYRHREFPLAGLNKKPGARWQAWFNEGKSYIADICNERPLYLFPEDEPKGREIARAGGYEYQFDYELKEDKYASVEKILERARSEYNALVEARKIWGPPTNPVPQEGGRMEDYLEELDKENK